jgi:Tol biopolymer transport system component
LTISAFKNVEPLTNGSTLATASPFLQTSGLPFVEDEGPAEAAQATLTPQPFHIEQASILYVDGDEQGQSQVFRFDLAGGEPVLLTQNRAGVQDYALSPDGTTIVYTAMREDGGSDLAAVNIDGRYSRKILSCPEATCSGAVWSPDGQRLVYERINPPSLNASSGLPSLWWLEVKTGETGPIFQDSQWPGFNPRWSPDGQWLSYIYPGSGKMELYNLTEGRRTSIPTQTGMPVVWSPQGDALLVTNVWNIGQRSLVHLFRFDLVSETLTDLSKVSQLGERPVMDSAVAWSPDGEWLAVVRRSLTEGGATSGSRLWLMRPDGREGRSLTEESDVVYGIPVWSPDSNYLLFHHYSLTESLATRIYLLDIKTGQVEEIVDSGNRPGWAP